MLLLIANVCVCDEQVVLPSDFTVYQQTVNNKVKHFSNICFKLLPIHLRTLRQSSAGTVYLWCCSRNLRPSGPISCNVPQLPAPAVLTRFWSSHLTWRATQTQQQAAEWLHKSARWKGGQQRETIIGCCRKSAVEIPMTTSDKLPPWKLVDAGEWKGWPTKSCYWNEERKMFQMLFIHRQMQLMYIMLCVDCA